MMRVLRNRFWLHSAALGLTAACAATGLAFARWQPVAQPEATPHEHDAACCGKAAMAYRMSGTELIDEEPQAVKDLLLLAFDDTDALHYDLEIEIFPSTAELAGTNVMTIESKVNGLTTFDFRLRSNYTITSALCNGTPISITDISTTTRRANLDQAYDIGETFDLTIVFDGPAVSRGFGSIEFGTQSGNSIVATLSEPYYAYTWWPCKDGDFGEPGDNADKATIDFAIIAPNNMVSTSNGMLQGIDALSGSRNRYRFSHSYPIATYLVAFSSTNYNTWTETFNYTGGSMPVEFHIYPSSDTSGNRAAWGECVDMLDTLSGLYGLYPFINEKYGIYQFPFGGGMEHQTNTGQGTFSESVTAHELGHQWWGDWVTCRTWGDIGLNEGGATYTEALWYEYQGGSSNKSALHSAMAAREPSSVGDSVYVYDPADVNRIFSYNNSYLKASWVYHMLRHVLGDSNFWTFLANYRATYGGSAATWDDFASVAAGVYGADMAWFFDEWVYGIGAPAYSYSAQHFAVNGQDYLRVYINQTQTASYGTYTMPLDLGVTHSSGSDLYKVWNDADPEHIVIPIDGVMSNYTLDPNNWVLNLGKSKVGFVTGPPVLLTTTIDPNSILPTAPTALDLTFSADVSISASDVSIVGDSTGAVSTGFSYSAGNWTASLTFAALPNDTYTVTVGDSVTASGIALDGEIAGGHNPGGLPSGEGQSGGDSVFSFAVAAPVLCPEDLNGDTQVDSTDLAILLGNFGTTSGAQPQDGDIDGDGDVDSSDLAMLLGVFGSTCP